MQWKENLAENTLEHAFRCKINVEKSPSIFSIRQIFGLSMQCSNLFPVEPVFGRYVTFDASAKNDRQLHRQIDDVETEIDR